MTKWIFAAGVAALALTTPSLASSDSGDRGNRGERAERGDRGDRGDRGGGRRAERGDRDDDRGERRTRRAERDDDDDGDRNRGRRAARAERDDDDDDRDERSGRRMVRAERGDDDRRRRVERQLYRADRQAARADRRDDLDVERRALRSVGFGDGRRDYRPLRDDARRFAGFEALRQLSRSDGCPPGLARRDNGCLAPGQAKRMIGAVIPAAIGSQLLAGPYRQWYRDNDQYYFRNDGDYIYRVNRQGGLINALFPSQDRDYSYYDVGTAYPADYNFYNIPQQYQTYYADGNDYNYRYGDGAIYQVNRSDNLISSIVALLAGDLAVGQQLPGNYDVYNVPMAFRDRYYDTADAQYRYNDGYIYQADPKTQLITAVIDALV